MPRTKSESKRKEPIVVRRFLGTEEHREQLSHLRIAHLTDLHFGRVTPMSVQRHAVELTNAGKPDLVVITGDFVCHSQLYLDSLVETLSKIQAPTMAVLGNHDYWSGADEVSAALGRAGVELLKNVHTTIELRHQKLQVVGLDDSYTGHADRERALRGLRADLPSIGLSHIAEEADGLWERGVPLVFSGHTHAGQVTVAKLHEIALGRVVGHKYVHGLYGKRRERSPGEPKGAVYVGAGIGAAVMPLRIGERGARELAMFELGADVEDFVEHHGEQSPHRGRKPSEELTQKRHEYVQKRMLAREVAAARAHLERNRAERRASQPPPGRNG